MRSTRFAVCAAAFGALAFPLAAAPTATAAAPTAAPAIFAEHGHRPCDRPGPWVIGTKAVTMRSKATTKSTAVGILYRGQSFTVHKTSGNWHHITNKTTKVKGWVSGTYVYRDVRMCLSY
ncbi:SH3 domain-containing protein [Streptomyces uncialis]|uniref:SH3 domain-containing protein n=1 Tax=Streptomyces uncialis TaxID=1048205 RepID=UPI002E374A8D|nr:SH3 domain-containing protein [Streptomyces uncialis]